MSIEKQIFCRFTQLKRMSKKVIFVFVIQSLVCIKLAKMSGNGAPKMLEIQNISHWMRRYQRDGAILGV